MPGSSAHPRVRRPWCARTSAAEAGRDPPWAPGGPEALTFGPAQVYVYVFGGGVPHLHVHPAAHVAGDALNDSLLRGRLEERKLPSGLTEFSSLDFEPVHPDGLVAVAGRVRDLLAP